MTETERRGIGKAKLGLAALTILAIILTASNILVYVNLQNQIDSLESDKTSLHGQMNTLQSQKSGLENQVDGLQNQVGNLASERDDLQDQVDSLTIENGDLQSQVDYLIDEKNDLWWELSFLKEPQLHKVETRWRDDTWDVPPHINYHGSIFNSGSWAAYNVVVTVRIYDAYDTLLKTEEIDLGSINGKSYQAFDVDIDCSGDPDSVYSTLTYD